MSQPASTEKKKNWFSRRYETREASEAAKKANAEEQAERECKRTPPPKN